MTYPKAKRGDVVVIQLTTAKFKTKKMNSYYLAKVTSTADGLVKAYRKANGAEGVVDTRHWVMCVSEPDKQAAVRKLFAEGDLDFADLDAIKKAILEAVELKPCS